MNRRDLFRRAGGAAVGLIAALIGIRPKTQRKVSLYDYEREELQLWFAERFYVDLPKDRYKDTVCVDWVMAKEWEDRYVARCRVCPELGQPWEVLPMKRANG